MAEPDRITYGLSFKRNLENYENVDVFFSVSSNVRDGETIDKAKDRVVAKVDSYVEAKIREIDADAGV